MEEKFLRIKKQVLWQLLELAKEGKKIHAKISSEYNEKNARAAITNNDIIGWNCAIKSWFDKCISQFEEMFFGGAFNIKNEFRAPQIDSSMPIMASQTIKKFQKKLILLQSLFEGISNISDEEFEKYFRLKEGAPEIVKMKIDRILNRLNN